MNCRVILAALAALCCVQGMTAALISERRPVHGGEMDVKLVTSVEDMLKIMLNDKEFVQFLGELDYSSLHTQSQPKSIISCVSSLASSLKTVKNIYNLYKEWKHVKKALKNAKKACDAAELSHSLKGADSECIAAAQAEYDEGMDAVKEQILPLVVEAATTIWAVVQGCI